jgi:hypothetical protein
MTTRQRCDGAAFDHEPTFMSLARALDDGVLLRCPLCLAEAVATDTRHGVQSDRRAATLSEI